MAPDLVIAACATRRLRCLEVICFHSPTPYAESLICTTYLGENQHGKKDHSEKSS